MQTKTRNMLLVASILAFASISPFINWYRDGHRPTHCEQHQVLVDGNGYETDLGPIKNMTMTIESLSEDQSLVVKDVCGIKD